jgi:hypothetical protein
MVVVPIVSGGGGGVFVAMLFEEGKAGPHFVGELRGSTPGHLGAASEDGFIVERSPADASADCCWNHEYVRRSVVIADRIEVMSVRVQSMDDRRAELIRGSIDVWPSQDHVMQACRARSSTAGVYGSYSSGYLLCYVGDEGSSNYTALYRERPMISFRAIFRGRTSLNKFDFARLRVPSTVAIGLERSHVWIRADAFPLIRRLFSPHRRPQHCGVA